MERKYTESLELIKYSEKSQCFYTAFNTHNKIIKLKKVIN